MTVPLTEMSYQITIPTWRSKVPCFATSEVISVTDTQGITRETFVKGEDIVDGSCLTIALKVVIIRVEGGFSVTETTPCEQVKVIKDEDSWLIDKGFGELYDTTTKEMSLVELTASINSLVNRNREQLVANVTNIATNEVVTMSIDGLALFVVSHIIDDHSTIPEQPTLIRMRNSFEITIPNSIPPLCRGTNTTGKDGIPCIVDDKGQVQAILPCHQKGSFAEMHVITLDKSNMKVSWIVPFSDPPRYESVIKTVNPTMLLNYLAFVERIGLQLYGDQCVLCKFGNSTEAIQLKGMTRYVMNGLTKALLH